MSETNKLAGTRNDEHRYDDILRCERPFSKKHPKMKRRDRAAQFAPFAALTGHEAAARETARLAEEEMENRVVREKIDET